eukprot:gb/GFBE01076655.1/.p1 GENE.gb/GFBE01076655.1/~~gb/GFBE01076655.1/.p1  ORF type:complete len:429 (+),score=77.29 gb/GFBE01076655.1/:1-1287(+)
MAARVPNMAPTDSAASTLQHGMESSQQEDDLEVGRSSAKLEKIGSDVSDSTDVPSIVLEEHTAQHKDAPDVVFLVHPAYLPDMFALFSKPSDTDRWRPSWWMWFLLPICWVVGFIHAHLQRPITGKSHYVVDDVVYSGVHVQTWIVNHFGRHFRNNCELKDSRKNVEVAALNAEKAGARVLGLGALNKAEFLNKGGRDLVAVMPKHRTMAITHGNHLTAAAVVENVRQLHEAGFAQGKPIFITGATSKTGRAVAIALWQQYRVPLLCHSRSPERRQDLEQHGLVTTDSFDDGKDCSMWIIGKYDLRVCKHIPYQAFACVFAVPDPLAISGKRRDVTIVEGATLHLDTSRLSKPRQFTNLLKTHEIYACHAGSIVRAAHPELGVADELGDIDPVSLPEYIKRAAALGITVPPPPLHLLGKLQRRGDSRR